MALHFSKEEFSKRKLNTLNSMKEKKLDALLMFRQESMYWLTGYDTFGYVFFQTLILDKSGNIILLTRAPSACNESACTVGKWLVSAFMMKSNDIYVDELSWKLLIERQPNTCCL